MKKFFKKNKNRVVPVASGEPFETLHARLRKHNAYGYQSVICALELEASSSSYPSRLVPYAIYNSKGDLVCRGSFSYDSDGDVYDSGLAEIEKILRKN